MNTNKDAFGVSKQHNKNCAIYRTAIQKTLIERDQWQTCLNCDMYKGTEEKPFCGLHKGVPPVSVVVCGCEDHLMKIPF